MEYVTRFVSTKLEMKALKDQIDRLTSNYSYDYLKYINFGSEPDDRLYQDRYSSDSDREATRRRIIINVLNETN